MLSNKEKNFISAVFYVHNNENEIEPFLTMLYRVFEKNFEKYEIICVNDYSTDASVEKIRSFAAGKSDLIINIINMSLYHGLELSMNAGVDLSIGDFIFEFDSLYIDYDENTIMDVYYQSLKGFDIVSAAPEKARKITSKIFYHLYNKYSGSAYKLRSENFRILSRRGINRVHSISKTIPYRKALYANSGLKMYTIIYKRNNSDRISYHSRQKSGNRRDIATDTFIMFTDIAYKLALILSAILLLSTIGSGIYTCIIYFGINQPVAGWTTTMLLLSGGFFGVFLLLTVIIKYLSVLVNLVFKKQKYLIESVEKI
jgi:glycosyltransferase involved in cell wall biosynthesis